MKRILFILFLTIPFFGFGQVDINSLENTSWEITQSNGDEKIIIIQGDGYFKYLKGRVRSDDYNGNVGQLFGDETFTWNIKRNNIIFSFNNGFKIYRGDINSEENFMSGNWTNDKKESGTWFGVKIE